MSGAAPGSAEPGVVGFPGARRLATGYGSLVGFEPLTCSFDGESRTLVVRGSIDELNTDELRSTLATCTDDYTHDLVVDLAGVNFLPSVGIGVLAAAMRQAREHGRTITLTTEQGSLSHRILAICGLPYVTSGAVIEQS